MQNHTQNPFPGLTGAIWEEVHDDKMTCSPLSILHTVQTAQYKLCWPRSELGSIAGCKAKSLGLARSHRLQTWLMAVEHNMVLSELPCSSCHRIFHLLQLSAVRTGLIHKESGTSAPFIAWETAVFHSRCREDDIELPIPAPASCEWGYRRVPPHLVSWVLWTELTASCLLGGHSTSQVLAPRLN